MIVAPASRSLSVALKSCHGHRTAGAATLATGGHGLDAGAGRSDAARANSSGRPNIRHSGRNNRPTPGAASNAARVPGSASNASNCERDAAAS